MSRQRLCNTLADHLRTSSVTVCTFNNNASAWQNASVTLYRVVAPPRSARRVGGGSAMGGGGDTRMHDAIAVAAAAALV